MTSLKDRSVLIVEDNAVVALDIAVLLRKEGCTVIGPCASSLSAIQAIADHQLDACVLDLDLNGEKTFSIADALTQRGVPYLWLTGYPAAAVPEWYRDRPFVLKPVAGAILIGELVLLVQTK
jgi:CheY-like chemotaxis protein